MPPDNPADRLPPGQYRTEKWPVLHYGSIPRFDPTRWDVRMFGEVERPLRLTYDEFMGLPQVTVTCDIHCVTAWSKLGVTFEGIAAKTVLEMAGVRSAARFVMVYAEHGWPLRLVVPRLYFWKSAKWVRGIEPMVNDRRGFWERNGYHSHGDPWKEERYSSAW